MNTDTPETDHLERNLGNAAHPVLSSFCRKLERERDEARAIIAAALNALPVGYIPSHTPESIPDRIADLVHSLRNLERECDEVRASLAEIEDKMRLELGGHPNSELWGEAGLIAATMRCVDALGKVTDERDEARREMAAIKAMLLDPVEVELDMIRGNIAIPERPEFSGFYDTGKAMANLIRERDEARFDLDFRRRLGDWQNKTIDDLTRQRDGLAEALQKVSTSWNFVEVVREALQSLTPNEKL